MTVAVILPVYNSSTLLGDTLLALSLGTRLPDELIVVDDGSTDDSASIAESCGAQALVMPRNVGPAACRNQGALLSRSEILIFLDADTCVHPATIEQLANRLAADTGLAAVFGSYDDTPREPGPISQYRNLAHCYVHRSAKHSALTFWSGCGAVRRSAFLAVNGFDERYRRPSIEDIELGYRMTDHGARILLDPEIYVTHTKRWTVENAVVTDVRDRGIPWMALLLERRRVPNDLNITRRHRISMLFTGLAFIGLAASFLSVDWLIVSAVLIVLALSMDVGLFRFIYRKRGFRLLLLAIGMTILQNICKTVAAAGGTALFIYRKLPSEKLRRGERRSCVQELRGAYEEQSASVSASSPSEGFDRQSRKSSPDEVI
jgi:glycosyltransferase involved in cell wall biosynthesis